MSKNNRIEIAKEFHESTKHSEISVRTSGHYLDWENKPAQFKIYQGLEQIDLPRRFPYPETDALTVVSGIASNQLNKLDLAGLAEILFFSAGITRQFRIGNEPHYMRAASATGALYPIELYVVAGGVEGLDAGVYHFDPFNFSLTCLRKGDYRGRLAEYSSTIVLSAPATIVFSSLAWRNSWKYQARSYRHWYWDGGVIVANMLAVASDMGLKPEIITGFVDEAVNTLLMLDHGKEATILMVRLGTENPRSVPAINNQPSVANLKVKTEPLSQNEIEYPEIWKLHEASSLENQNQVDSWLVNRLDKQQVKSTGKPIPLPAEGPRTQKNLRETILQRGSTRKFARAPVSFEQLSTILRISNSKLPVDYSTGMPVLDTYFIANMVDGLRSASYHYLPNRDSIEELQNVESRRTSAYLSLEQPLFGEASIVFYLMADLDQFLEKLGNRGYRIAQLEGGIIAGRIYLTSYALGLGASGSTFYDDMVTEFFSPSATGLSPMIEVAVGVPGYKAKSGRILPQFS